VERERLIRLGQLKNNGGSGLLQKSSAMKKAMAVTSVKSQPIKEAKAIESRSYY